MENQLNLDIILNFLVNDKSTKNQKPKIENINLDYLDTYNSINFNNFNNFFNNHVDRVGIKPEYYNSNSLYFSLLYLLNKNFCLLDDEQQFCMIKTLKTKIKDDMTTRNFKKPIDLTKKNIINRLNKSDNNFNDAYILACYFNINIYIFSYTSLDVHVFYNDEKLNIYKMNLFLNEINDIYYPLSYKCDNGRYFKYNSTILNNVIFSDKIKPFNIKNTKLFEISNSWEEILKDYLDLDTSNIIIDIDDKKLNKLMAESETDSDSDSNIDFENLTEEMNKVDNDINLINSDNISLDNISLDNSDEEMIDLQKSIIIEDNNKNEGINNVNEEINNVNEEINNIYNEIKNYSDSKFKKLKKDILIEYLSILLNVSKDSIYENTKQNIINNLKEEMQKFI